VSLTFGHFLAKTADLLAPAIKRASAVDDDGNVLGVNAEAPDQRAALIAALLGASEQASGRAPIAGNRTTAGNVGPFTPIAGRAFNVTIAGGEGVSAQIERSFDAGANWYVKYRAADLAALPPTFSDTESEVGVQYRVVVTAIASGTVTIRLSQ
jgi:hypothetical protein